jgi:hypothetical protein
MSDYHQPAPPDKDPGLWQIARKRVAFKYHAATYIMINIFFWILWYFTGGQHTDEGWPWPVWPMFGWGIGLFFHWLSAYVLPGENSVEKEYEKLKNQQRK